MAGVTNREFWDFRVKTRAQFTKLAEQIANIDTSGGGGISELTSKMVVDALGYTPYNANNPANYITSAALTPYLKTEDAEETYATKDFVNNKLVDYAPLTSVQGFENRIGGLEGAVPRLNARVETVESKVATLNEYVVTGDNNLLNRVNVIEQEYATKTYVDDAIDGIDLSAYLLKADLTKSRIQSTLGISDWALAATKPSYAWSEITSRPTALSQFTDDVVAGKYLPLSGGNIVSDKELILYIISSSPNSYAKFNANGRNRASVGYYNGLSCIANEISYARIGVTDTGEPQYRDSNRTDANKYTLLHSGNIGSYNAGSANILQTSDKYYVTANTRDDYWKVALKIGGWDSLDAGFATKYGTAVDIAGFGTWYHRLGFNTNGTIEHWMGINTTTMSRVGYLAYTTSNVASATKLATARTLWGQSFDGTSDVNGRFASTGENGGFALYSGIRHNEALSIERLSASGTWLGLGITLNLDGNVGIDNTSPTERLDVSGNIKASGNINATSITINGVTITASNGTITVNGNVFAKGDITGGV